MPTLDPDQLGRCGAFGEDGCVNMIEEVCHAEPAAGVSATRCIEPAYDTAHERPIVGHPKPDSFNASKSLTSRSCAFWSVSGSEHERLDRSVHLTAHELAPKIPANR